MRENLESKFKEEKQKLERKAEGFHKLALISFGTLMGGFLSNNAYVGMGGAAASVVFATASLGYGAKLRKLSNLSDNYTN